MHKRFRKNRENISIAEESNSEEDSSFVNVRKPPFNLQKYKRMQCAEAADISESSNDEDINSQEKEEQENRRSFPRLRSYKNRQKIEPFTPTNKFQPLCITVSAKRESSLTPTQLVNAMNTSDMSCSIPRTPTTSGQTAWCGLRNTLSLLKPKRRSMLNNSYQDAVEDTFLDCTPSPSIESNLQMMVENQQQVAHSTRKSLAGQRQRCVRGGYLEEYKRMMQKQRMDRRNLNHNQRLGITAEQRVRVLVRHESFGAHMVRVQSVQCEDDIFNIIVCPRMAFNICTGSLLDLYFDTKMVSAMKLPNRELVYIEPNKLVLL